MYSSEDILWIKNVKRNKGDGWAYDDVNCGRTFWLNWPTAKKGSVSTPQIGDIIALFQKPNEINGKRNYKVHLTHLVSPVSETIHEDKDSPDHKWCREVQPIAISNPIYSIPNPGYFNFFKPNRGLTNPIKNLTNNIGFSELETKDNLWELFAPYFCINLQDEIFQIQNPTGIFGEIEGDKVIRLHIKLELTRRNQGIVRLAKSLAYKNGDGRIKCECCKFDFVESYGTLGDSFIEAHHKTHISTGERITSVDDLALVCSNCHKMLHRKRDNGEYHDINSLKNLFDKRRNKYKS